MIHLLIMSYYKVKALPPSTVSYYYVKVLPPFTDQAILMLYVKVKATQPSH